MNNDQNPVTELQEAVSQKTKQEVKEGELFHELRDHWYKVVVNIIDPMVENEFPRGETDDILKDLKGYKEFLKNLSNEIHTYSVKHKVPPTLSYSLLLLAIELTAPTDFGQKQGTVHKDIMEALGASTFPTSISIIYTSWMCNIAAGTNATMTDIMTRALQNEIRKESHKEV